MAEAAGTVVVGVDAGVRIVREERIPGPVPLYVHPLWAERFPWLLQGTTGRGEDGFDLGLFGAAAVGEVLERWRRLGRATGFRRTVHARQVHGARVLCHDATGPGLLIAEGYDGHATATAGVLLTVSVADCVPVFLVDPTHPVVAAVHGGWRGGAAGVLEAGLDALAHMAGSRAEDVHVHLGPSICGRCYEVGPEVHEALGLEQPDAPRPVDLRRVLAARARTRGVPVEQITRSAFCTRCGGEGAEEGHASPFYSHRGGCVERQMGVLGLRAGGVGGEG